MHKVLNCIFLIMYRYRPYLQEYDTFTKKINELSSKKQYKTLFENAKKESKERLDFDSLIIMPVQRLPRYILLLKELNKALSPNDDNKVLCDKVKVLIYIIRIH